MILEFFIHCKTKEDARQEFLKLCLKLHPDKGGDHSRFVRMQREYEHVSKILPNEENKKETSSQNELNISEVIEKLCRLRDIDIELCGVWLWVTGDTYNNKERLKEFGFKYSKKKKSWYWFESISEKVKGKWFGKKSMEDIRNKYGSEKYQSLSSKTQVQTV